MSQDDDQQNFVLAIVFAIILGVVAFTIGIAVHGANKAKAAKQAKAAPAALVAVPMAAAASASATSAPATAASASTGAGMVAVGASAPAASDASASVQVEAGLVKFFFASGKTSLADGAEKAVAETVRGAQAGKKAIISGYSDASGDQAKNAELAKLRAFAVRDALINLGVKASQIELRKPADVRANAAGSSADARRVDVTLE